MRRSHALLVVPTGTPPPGGFPAVITVNGHSGSAWRMMHPSTYRREIHNWYDPIYWYGDSFARRNFVVLVIDISHRNNSPLYGQDGHPTPDWWEDGDYRDHGNGLILPSSHQDLGPRTGNRTVS